MISLQENWDEEIGLWWQDGPGHTLPVSELERVHSGSSASTRLVYAAEEGRLDEIDIALVLGALTLMQVRDENDERDGCLKWYWEEPEPRDTNASFFTGLGLIVLRKLHYAKLDSTSQALLDRLLQGLRTWFLHAIAEQSHHYPNKYLGDLVCGWLLQEIAGVAGSDTLVLRCMHEAAEYWLTQGWGWGEHMSDVYARVCLDELSLLLLLGEELPDATRKKMTQLTDALLDIEDAYGGEPRVPALRSYAFEQSPEHVRYRDRIKPRDPETLVAFRNLPDLGDLLYRLGWHDKVSPAGPCRTEISIPCHNGTMARAHCEPDTRLGSVSRFPVMPEAEYPTWGLSWQCFPVAIWRRTGDWGFLQWQTTEDGTRRAHPSEGKHSSYLYNALTRSVSPPIVGRTYCFQRGGGVIALRVMPQIATQWETLSDRFRLLEYTGKPPKMETHGPWSQLLLTYPERTISVHHIDLVGDIRPTLVENNSAGFDWQISQSALDLKRRRLHLDLWAISLDGQVETPPRLERLPHLGRPMAPEENEWDLHWPWPNETWKIRISPLSEAALRVL